MRAAILDLPPRRPTTSQASRAAVVGGLARPVKRVNVSTWRGRHRQAEQRLQEDEPGLPVGPWLEPGAEEMWVSERLDEVQGGRGRAGPMAGRSAMAGGEARR